MSTNLAHSLEKSFRTKDVITNNDVTFDSLLLPGFIYEGLKRNGFKQPSPIQLKAIPVGRCGFDIIVKSKSGTGKTLVFTIIGLETVNTKKKEPTVLVLCPTREIAVQVQEVFQLIGCCIEGLKVESFIGGTSLEGDKEKCKSCHIVVGTPGRIKHLILEKSLNMKSVRLFVLDEVDKLMEETFLNDINEIYNKLPSKKQMITTSATYPKSLQKHLGGYMLSPTCITSELETPFLLGLKQFVSIIDCDIEPGIQIKHKTDELKSILSTIAYTQCLVFFNYQSRTESISNILNRFGWQAACIHAGQTQDERLKAVNKFKTFHCRILTSTDVTARGIDAANVDLVINFDIPADAMTYLHRMGRAGRYGSSGVCINLSTLDEVESLQKILGCIGGTSMSIPKLPQFTGPIQDLLKVDVPHEDHLSGIVSSSPDEDLRNRIQELKKGIRKEHDRINLSKDIMDALNNDTSDLNAVKELVSEMDNESILARLASGNFEFDTVQQTHRKSNDLSLVSEIVDSKDNRSPTSDSTVSSSSNRKCVKKQKLDETFCKNRALLDVAKILHNGDGMSQGGNSIQQYLDRLNENDATSKYVEKTIPELLDALKCDGSIVNEDNDVSHELEDNVIAKNDDLERIFEVGYNSIVMSQDKGLQKYLQKLEEKQNRDTKNREDESTFVNDGQSESSEKSDQPVEIMKWMPVKKSNNESRRTSQMNAAQLNTTNWVNDQNYQEKEAVNTSNAPDCEAESSSSQGSGSDDRLNKWVPVQIEEQKERYNALQKAQSDVEKYEHFQQYFNHCNDNLWNNGLRFSDVESFDDWFAYDWEAQLYAVRNYVQQNIYLEEMKKVNHHHRK